MWTPLQSQTAKSSTGKWSHLLISYLRSPMRQQCNRVLCCLQHPPRAHDWSGWQKWPSLHVRIPRSRDARLQEWTPSIVWKSGVSLFIAWQGSWSHNTMPVSGMWAGSSDGTWLVVSLLLHPFLRALPDSNPRLAIFTVAAHPKSLIAEKKTNTLGELVPIFLLQEKRQDCVKQLSQKEYEFIPRGGWNAAYLRADVRPK